MISSIQRHFVETFTCTQPFPIPLFVPTIIVNVVNFYKRTKQILHVCLGSGRLEEKLREKERLLLTPNSQLVKFCLKMVHMLEIMMNVPRMVSYIQSHNVLRTCFFHTLIHLSFCETGDDRILSESDVTDVDGNYNTILSVIDVENKSDPGPECSAKKG